MKTFLILFPFALAAVVLGAAWVGVIEVPGLSPEVAVAKKKTSEHSTTGGSALPLEPLPAKTPVAIATTDPEEGHKKVAYLWESIETDKLVPIVEKWRDADLAAVLAKMDVDKVAALLSSIDEVRASRLSKELQKQAAAKPTS